MEKIRVALVHDWLTGQRGGEKVLEVLAEIFPRGPDLYALPFQGQPGARRSRAGRSGRAFSSGCPSCGKSTGYYLPLFPLAVELFDLGGLRPRHLELALRGQGRHPPAGCPPPQLRPFAHALRLEPVFRLLLAPSELSLFSPAVVPPVMHRLRVWDESSAARVDHFIANSGERRPADQEVLPPGRPTSSIPRSTPSSSRLRPRPSERTDFLIVSALVPYKRIDLAIEAFNRTGEQLKIVGDGPDLSRLARRARPEHRVSRSGPGRRAEGPLPEARWPISCPARRISGSPPSKPRPAGRRSSPTAAAARWRASSRARPASFSPSPSPAEPAGPPLTISGA